MIKRPKYKGLLVREKEFQNIYPFSPTFNILQI